MTCFRRSHLVCLSTNEIRRQVRGTLAPSSLSYLLHKFTPSFSRTTISFGTRKSALCSTRCCENGGTNCGAQSGRTRSRRGRKRKGSKRGGTSFRRVFLGATVTYNVCGDGGMLLIDITDRVSVPGNWATCWKRPIVSFSWGLPTPCILWLQSSMEKFWTPRSWQQSSADDVSLCYLRLTGLEHQFFSIMSRRDDYRSRHGLPATAVRRGTCVCTADKLKVGTQHSPAYSVLFVFSTTLACRSC